jgi:hypothetical protein
MSAFESLARRRVLFKSTVRLLFAAFVFVALYEGVSHLFATSVDGEGLNLARAFLFEVRRSEALDLRAEEIAESTEMKTKIIDDLLAERLTFHEAKEKFREAIKLVRNNNEGLVPKYRLAETDRELTHQVINWIENRLKESYSHKEARRIHRRLHREIKEHFPNDNLLY